MTDDEPTEAANCTHCGASDFEWGWVHGRSSTAPLLYSETKSGKFFGITGMRVKSWRCLACNQLAFFCDTEPWPVRFNLRTLFIAMTVIAVVLGLLAFLYRAPLDF